MRTEQAGGKAGSKAGGEAGSKAGGEAGSKAGGKAGSKAGGEAGSKAGGKAGRVYNDVGAASETDATSGSQKKKKKKKKKPPPKCGFCETITEQQCGNYGCKGGACDEHLQHRWLNGRFSTRRYCPKCMEGPVQAYFGGPLLGYPEAAAGSYMSNTGPICR